MKKRLIALSALLATSMLMISAPAYAETPNSISPTPNTQCPNGGTEYDAVGDTSLWTQASGVNARVSGGPNITLGINTSTEFTISGTISASTGVSASVAIATVHTDYGISISTGYTRTSGVSGSWTVPSSYTNGGSLAIGSMKHTGMVYKYQLNTSCAPTTIIGAGAKYNAPVSGWYFKSFKL